MDAISILTPTGDRPEALAHLVDYVARQTYRGAIQWVIVDDGRAPHRPAARAPSRAAAFEVTYHRRDEPGVPGGSLNRNLITALRLAKHPALVMMEDDDWYAPTYLETYAEALDFHPLVGESRARYYHVKDRAWYLPNNTAHASLAQTGFRRELIPQVDRCCRQGTPFIDLHVWRLPVEKHLLHAQGLVVGLKGGPGRRGLGQGGHQAGRRYKPDPHLRQLRAWIGDDVERYAPLAAGGQASSVSSSWFQWIAGEPEAPPWLIIGKGPTFSRGLAGEFGDLHRFRTMGLNHVCRSLEVDVAHIIDLEALDELGEQVLRAGRLVMPWHPHRGHKPQPETLAQAVDSRPVLARLAAQGRLLHYHLLWAEKFGSRPAGEPVVGVKDYSIQPATNLVIGRGLRGIFTLGIDGGRHRAAEFSDLPASVAQRVGYDRQFKELERIARVNRAAIWPLGGDPLRGSHLEAVRRLRPFLK